MLEMVLGSDGVNAFGPALRTSKQASAQKRCFSRRLASIRSRWEATEDTY
jgi:hypothetical protein